MNPLHLQIMTPQGFQISNSTLSADLCKKISSLEAFQIELISREIAKNLIANLGPVGKARVAQQVLVKKETHAGEFSNMLMEKDLEKKDTFFSDKFLLPVLDSIRRNLEISFSHAEWFVELGYCFLFSYSDCKPYDSLEKIAKSLDIDLTADDLPNRYEAHLKLDKKLALEKSDLVFVLTEESENVEFSKKIFTLEELEQAYLSSFIA